jgi:hypothetical protein
VNESLLQGVHRPGILTKGRRDCSEEQDQIRRVQEGE